MHRIGIIDLGTNTFHLLIADVGSKGILILHKEKQSVKIGENGISKGKIAKPAQERAVHTLQEFKEKMNSMGVQQVHATATSAFRNAANGQELAEEILSTTGININIIDGRQEAQLIYQGVRQALDLGTSNALIMDIGGGSVEFIIADSIEVKWMHSFEIGAQRLMDQFHHRDPISMEEIARLEAFLDKQLAKLTLAIREHSPRLLVGASGTFDTMSDIYCIQQGIDKTDAPERPLTIDGFKRIHHHIIHKRRVERLAIAGMSEMRVDMIVVASSLINFVLDRFEIAELKVSSYALKEGALKEISDLKSQS